MPTAPTSLPTAAAPGSAEPCDVVVIGGGPGGSTIAALLAAQGRSVVLLEKSRHPRFHIGESLLPANVPLFERLGVRDEVARVGMPKWGVEFVSQQHTHRSFLEFGDAWDKSQPMAWQVRRFDLDAILFAHAARRGARTFEDCRVRGVDFDAGGATVQALHEGRARAWRARHVVDASGRDTLLAHQFGDKQRNPRHDSSAIFGHFRGAERLEGEKLEGNISIFWFAHGWFWFIPLADGTTSVGATCWPRYLKSRDKPLVDFFRDTIAMAPELQRRLANATLVDDRVHATGNFSYSTGAASGAGWTRVGDAYAFIDPVFSSGVYLAMCNAFEAAGVVGAALDGSARAAAAARRRYERHVRRGPRAFSWFIYRMTNPAMRELFMRPANVMRAQEAVLSVLAGDIYGGSPIGPSLAFFKAVYYAFTLGRWRASWAAWRRRRSLLGDEGEIPGENVLEPTR